MGFLGKIAGFFRSSPTATTIYRTVRGRFDAAGNDPSNSSHWLDADSLDADSAHSKAVRSKISYRARSEVGNNGHGKGIVLTQANYVVGRGPKLRVQTNNGGFNAVVEAAWNRWAKKVKLARKLRTADKAKTTDGEAFLVISDNPRLPDPVQLDLHGIEAEQVTTPMLAYAEAGKIDGIEFDEFGNPLFYSVLPHHPGGALGAVAWATPKKIPAKFMLHMFREDRPGQHRGLSELSSTLNLFAQGRRYREATIQAAENIASFSLFVTPGADPDTGPEQPQALSTLEIERGMMTVLPSGGTAFQPKAEQPTATYAEFTKSQLNEEARPLSMPTNIAGCDSSGYSFSGGKLDHLTYWASVDVEQADIEDQALDPLFDLWFMFANDAYGWNVDTTPAHSWDWPARPVIDETKTANARKINLSIGTTTLRRIYAEDGLDFEDELLAMSEDYGIPVEVLRQKLFEAAVAGAAIQPSAQAPDEPTPPKPTNRLAQRAGVN